MAALALLAPMPEEARALRARLRAPRRLRTEHGRFWRGELAGREVVLGVVGDGTEAPLAAWRCLLALERPEAVVILGVAGALDARLEVGSLVAVQAARGPERELMADPAWTQRLVDVGARRGLVLGQGQLVSTPAERAALAAAVGDALAIVDLETAPLARCAAEADLPWAALRAVSDGADESLPPILLAAGRPDGSTSRGRVIQGLVRRPGQLPALLRLGRRAREASEALAAALEAALVRR